MLVTFKFNRVLLSECSETKSEVQALPRKGDCVRDGASVLWSVNRVVFDLAGNIFIDLITTR